MLIIITAVVNDSCGVARNCFLTFISLFNAKTPISRTLKVSFLKNRTSKNIISIQNKRFILVTRKPVSYIRWLCKKPYEETWLYTHFRIHCFLLKKMDRYQKEAAKKNQEPAQSKWVRS
jgi:hypothetical protein